MAAEERTPLLTLVSFQRTLEKCENLDLIACWVPSLLGNKVYRSYMLTSIPQAVIYLPKDIEVFLQDHKHGPVWTG